MLRVLPVARRAAEERFLKDATTDEYNWQHTLLWPQVMGEDTQVDDDVEVMAYSATITDIVF